MNSQRASAMPTHGALYRLLLLLLILLGFGLRLHELTQQNIWWDEARNIDVALRPFWQIPNAPELDIHPPIYFWLLHLWARMLGLADSTQINVASIASPAQLTYIVRSLSAFANTLGVALLFALMALWRSTFTKQAVLIAGSIAVLSPFWVAESQEARMYTVSFTLLLVAAVGLMRSVDQRSMNQRSMNQRSMNRRSMLIFVLFSVLALLTHYNALFIVVAWYLWLGGWCLLQPKPWVQLRRVIGYGLLMSALVLPIAPIAIRQIPGYSNPNLTVPSISFYLVANWQAYFGGYAHSSGWFRWNGQRMDTPWFWIIGTFAAVGLVILVWQAIKDNASSSQGRFLSFLMVWLIGGLALYYIAVIDRGAFNPRYSSFVTPALYVLIAAAFASWSYLHRGVTAVAVLLLATGFMPSLVADIYDEQFAREDMQQTVTWLEEHAGPEDVIFVDQKYPFGFYYDRFVIEAAEAYPASPKAPARYLFVDINTIDQRLTEWAANAEQIFWIQWFESDTDPRKSVRFLLDQAGDHGGERHFRGYTVDWWTMQPPTTFELAPNLEPATHIFPPAVETVALSLPDAPVQRGSAVPITIRWTRVTEGEIDRPLKARIALYRPGEGSRLGQDDKPLLNDRHLMPSEWGREDQPLNVYAIPVPVNLPSGTYEARLLIYDEESLEPLTYVDIAGNPAGIEAVIGTVEIIE